MLYGVIVFGQNIRNKEDDGEGFRIDGNFGGGD